MPTLLNMQAFPLLNSQWPNVNILTNGIQMLIHSQWQPNVNILTNDTHKWHSEHSDVNTFTMAFRC